MKPTLKGEIPVGDEQEAGQGYAEAESILDDWSYRDLPDGEDIIWAIQFCLEHASKAYALEGEAAWLLYIDVYVEQSKAAI